MDGDDLHTAALAQVLLLRDHWRRPFAPCKRSLTRDSHWMERGNADAAQLGAMHPNSPSFVVAPPGLETDGPLSSLELDRLLMWEYVAPLLGDGAEQMAAARDYFEAGQQSDVALQFRMAADALHLHGNPYNAMWHIHQTQVVLNAISLQLRDCIACQGLESMRRANVQVTRDAFRGFLAEMFSPVAPNFRGSALEHAVEGAVSQLAMQAGIPHPYGSGRHAKRRRPRRAKSRGFPA